MQGETEAGGGGAVGRGGQLGGRQGEGVQEEVRSAQVRGREDKKISRLRSLYIAMVLWVKVLFLYLPPGGGQRKTFGSAAVVAQVSSGF